uniref:Uncharacterized protein n=1 Tax=Anguilla anguilla TaxID=7936 RepID=A0A0E9UNT9_ANGAN
MQLSIGCKECSDFHPVSLKNKKKYVLIISFYIFFLGCLALLFLIETMVNT